MNSYPKTVEELPSTPYFGILDTCSFHIPGDERSRTNPGHGYPAHTEISWSLQTFVSKSKWEEEIASKIRRGDKNFQAVQIFPAKVSVETKVRIE